MKLALDCPEENHVTYKLLLPKVIKLKAFPSKQQNEEFEKVMLLHSLHSVFKKADVLSPYKRVFIYALYHGKCLS